jgi:L-fuculose-phosphate aldolase
MLEEERQAVADACRSLAGDRLVAGTSGNVSARNGDRVAISPTGAVLAEVDAADVAVVDLGGDQLDGPLAPTSEIDLHLGVYRDRDDAGAVVHTHAPVATALSCVLDELPVVHYEMLLLGGSVRVAPYETFGTPELAAAAVAALEGRSAVLLANHGTVCQAADLPGALRATALLEWVATLYMRASALGDPRTLDADQQRAVIEVAVSRSYGKTRPSEDG